MLQMTQDELKRLYTSGKTCIWQYKTRYQVDYSNAQQMYILWKAGRFDGKMGITKRGRFIATTPEQGRKMEEDAYKLDINRAG